MSLTITIPGAVEATIGATAPAVLTINVGTPGATGPAGAPGVGVPAGGLTAQFLQKTSNTSYATDWVTLPAYLPLAGGTMNVNAVVDFEDTTAGTLSEVGGYGMAVSSASNVNLLTNVLYDRVFVKNATSQTTLKPTGVEFPDSTLQVTAGLSPATAASTYAVTARGLPASGTVGQVLTKQSGTAYDSAWATLIPGDRYLTTSSTSLTIDNANKTLTVGTGLSYSDQQDIVISYDPAHHMHAQVLAYNSSTGQLDVDVLSHTGSGTFAAWTVNVGGATPLQSVYWGEVLGTIGDQADLATALNGKLEVSTAASTYYPLSGNPSGFLTSAPVSSVAGRTGAITLAVADVSGAAPTASPTFTGKVTTAASTASSAGFRITQGVAPTSPVSGDVWNDGTNINVNVGGTTQKLPALATTNTFTASNTFSGGFVASNGVVTLGSFDGTQTITVGGGLTTTGLVKTINIGRNGATGSTTNITLGADPVGDGGTTAITIYGPTTFSGANIATTVQGSLLTSASTTTRSGFRIAHGAQPTSPVNGDIWTTTSGLFGWVNGAVRQFGTLSDALTYSGNNIFSGATLTFGNTTAASTVNIATGATLTATVKAVNIATNGVAGSTTNVIIGSTTGTSTTTLQGTTNGVTATAGDSTTALATTAFVTTADNLKANLASPSLTGTPLSTTAAADTNTTQIATTAYVVGQVSSTAPASLGTAAVGTSLKYARADHVHANPLPTGGTANQVLSKIDATNYNVQWSTLNASADVQVFSTAGSATWTKPAGKTMVWVRLYGGGGGGGSGTRQATTSIRGGGAGGGAGGYLEFFISAAALPSTVTVNVGAGGVGGAAISVDSTAGNAGANATASYSQFQIYRAAGGFGGQPGTNTAGGTGGNAQTTVVNGITGTAVTAGGTGGSAAAPTAPTASTTAYHQSTSAGGGAGQAASVTTAVAGAAGANRSSTAVGLMATVAGGTGGTTAGVVPTAGASGVTNWYGGTGAGGGAYITGVAGMAGAIGGQPGGGGGGGAASDNGFNSGAGGNGGDGLVVVVSY